VNFDDRVKKAVQEMMTLGYKPKAFMSMTFQYGTIDAVKMLINSSKVSDGFTKLWELHRLDLSMENIIQEKDWYNLFTDDERMKAKKRLADYGYNI
jgi:hypothetical protein